DQDSQVGAYVFPPRPVEGEVVSDGADEPLSKRSQSLVPENCHGAIIDFQGIVECGFLFRGHSAFRCKEAAAASDGQPNFRSQRALSSVRCMSQVRCGTTVGCCS